MKLFTLGISFFIFPFFGNSQIDWVAETGLSLGSTFIDNQIITDFGGTGLDVRINVNIVGGNPSIHASDPNTVYIRDNENASFTLTVLNGTTDIQLLNQLNLQAGENITVSNVDGSPITITETSSNGGARMTVDGTVMTGALPSTIVAGSSTLVTEQNDGAGTAWSANMSGVSSVTWLYNTSAGVSATEGFSMTLSNIVLPIELLTFKAKEEFDQTDVILNWQTAVEINNDFFTVERSKNGITWEDVVEVDGAGNSNVILSYKDYDRDPYEGISYYRLRQTDFNGYYSYSQVETVNFEGIKIIQLFPNPTSGNLSLTMNSSQEGEIDIKLFDKTGRVVYSSSEMIEKGFNTVERTLSGFAEGSYSLSITLNGTRYSDQEAIIIRPK